MRRTNRNDGVIIYWDHETGAIRKEWNSLAEWLNCEMEEGKMLVNYDGSNSNYFDFL
ncbi:MAG: SMI1/KNR4 family protein [Roseburia sp.]|nr:SMI1/KNR4 family protein [Roseburia sp.]